VIEIFKELQRYNYWSKHPKIPTGYLRKGYLKRIEPYLGNNLIKVLVGQRRSGKSYLLRQIIQKLIEGKVHPTQIFYLNKELVGFDAIRTYKDLFKLLQYARERLKVKGKMYILLDEVQEIAGWEKLVNSLAQDYKNAYEVFVTGSNSTMLSGELATLLSGRHVAFEIAPFLFTEYTEYLGLEKNKTIYLSYLQSGG
jgi:predicted AAA+ superfamily ATPase